MAPTYLVRVWLQHTSYVRFNLAVSLSITGVDIVGIKSPSSYQAKVDISQAAEAATAQTVACIQAIASVATAYLCANGRGVDSVSALPVGFPLPLPPTSHALKFRVCFE